MAIGDISMPLLDEHLDEPLHAIDMLRSAGLRGRRQRVERRHILMKGQIGAGGQRLDRLSVLRRRRDDLVVNIRDVTDIDDVLELLLQQSKEYVKDNDR